MKKLLSYFILAGALTLTSIGAFAQNESDSTDMTASEDSVIAVEEEVAVEPSVMQEEVVQEEASFHQVVKQQFIDGGPEFMGIVLICLILGLAISI